MDEFKVLELVNARQQSLHFTAEAVEANFESDFWRVTFDNGSQDLFQESDLEALEKLL